MENQDLEVFDDGEFNNEAPRKRPDFITVLAILSWVFVGYAVVIRVFSSQASPDEMEIQFAAMEASMQSNTELAERIKDDFLEYYQVNNDNFSVLNFGQLLFLLLEGIAIYMMFTLKRMGFWLYTIAQIGFIGVCFYVFPADNLMATFVLTYYIFIILLFEILYAVNLKHMKA
jgi:hypothetical protein